MTTEAPKKPAPSFEEALERLDDIVEKLEDGELPLDDAIARFEEGLALLKQCRARLEGAELRVKELLASGAVSGLEEE